jgi:precorrin-3B synthase
MSQGDATVRTVPLDITPPAASARAPRNAADRCPTAIALHAAADGLIARVRLPGGRLTPTQARMLATWAEPVAGGSGADAASVADRHGADGGVTRVAADRIELTGRGNLQIRGLVAGQAGPLAAALHGAGLLPSEPHDQARTIVASPLAGRLPGTVAVDALVRSIDEALCDEPDLAALSGRFLIAVDDGFGAVDVAGADLALVAGGGNRSATLSPSGIEGALAGERLTLLVGGVVAGSVGAHEAPDALMAAAYAFLRDAAGSAWRVTELADGGAAIRADLAAAGIVEPFAGWSPTKAATTVRELPPIGVGRQADGRAFVRVATVLGRLTAAQLLAVADAAEAGRTEVRIATDRSVTLPDLAPKHAAAALATLTGAGLITEPDDPSLGLTACAGLGCAKAAGDVRAAAHLRSRTRRPGAPREHLVGCERRCGAPASGTTLVLEAHETPDAFAARAASAAGATLETDR